MRSVRVDLQETGRKPEKVEETPGWAEGEGLTPGDAYEERGFLVFTAQYHLRRGYCCNSGCRHCPYRD